MLAGPFSLVLVDHAFSCLQQCQLAAAVEWVAGVTGWRGREPAGPGCGPPSCFAGDRGCSQDFRHRGAYRPTLNDGFPYRIESLRLVVDPPVCAEPTDHLHHTGLVP
jgi:hypothetical protein